MPINSTPKGGPSSPHAPAPEAPRATIQAHTRSPESVGAKILEKLQQAQPAASEAATKASNQSSTVTEPEAASAEAPSKPLDPQYAVLARQTAALRKAQQELKRQQEAWKAREAEYVPKSLFKEDVGKALAEAGISYDQLVESQLADPKSPEQQKIAALEERLAKFEASSQEQANTAYQQALKQIERDTDLLVSSDPAYETIKATGSNKEVVNLIEAVFKAEGHVLTVEEAAKEVEDLLTERSIESVKKLSTLSKIREKLEPKPQPQAEREVPQARPTLRNNMTSTKPLTPRERAILAYEGRLK